MNKKLKTTICVFFLLACIVMGYLNLSNSVSQKEHNYTTIESIDKKIDNLNNKIDSLTNIVIYNSKLIEDDKQF